ncbi:hypothetical protein PR001_g13206 [Phytophthora rubi]|uniref:DDE-1 domain-containing protein n=1 Tax=Phytophthora rubi TaxID=129364 RepID=A0A6A3M179_9STRA|nr:hypothetical protein PR001_g13206 [Phytophthora rubi]
MRRSCALVARDGVSSGRMRQRRYRNKEGSAKYNLKVNDKELREHVQRLQSIREGSVDADILPIILEAARLDELLLLLPSNATQLHQPLDVAALSLFKVKLRRLTEIYAGETGCNSVNKAEAIKMASPACVSCEMGKNVKAGFAGCGLIPPSKPRMDACIKNFKRNGTPVSTRLVSWLRTKAVVQKEVLVLPPFKNCTHKTATAPGSDGSESDGDVAYSIPACAVDTDPNIMDRGANQCTALNLDEDPDLCEEPEDEEDADDDSWTEAWDIGELMMKSWMKYLRNFLTQFGCRLRGTRD